MCVLEERKIRILEINDLHKNLWDDLEKVLAGAL